MELVAALVGVLVGFGLGLVPPWLDRKRRLRVHFSAMKAEMNICADLAATYLRDNVQAPLCRLPTDAYSTALSALLLDGALEEPESRALAEYYGLVAQLNRGLDNADHFHRVEHHQLRNVEYERNRGKAEQLIANTANGKYPIAMKVIETHL